MSIVPWPACFVFFLLLLPTQPLHLGVVPRRAILSAPSLALVPSLLLPFPSLALETPPVTHLVRFGVRSPSSPPVYLTLGMYGSVAPASVASVLQLASGTYLANCVPSPARSTAREALEGRRAVASCEASRGEGAGYDGSTLWRVVKDERIDVGAVRSKFLGREEPAFPDEGMGVGVGVDAKGAVSVIKGGGGGFGFSITPTTGPHPSLAKHVVIGHVVEGLDSLAALNEVGVRKPSFGSGGELRDKPSRECRYGSYETGCTDYKPLQKWELVDVSVKKA